MQVLGNQVGNKRHQQHKADNNQVVLLYAHQDKAQDLAQHKADEQATGHQDGKLQPRPPPHKGSARYRSNGKPVSHQR